MPTDPALEEIAGTIHRLDIEDGKYVMPRTDELASRMDEICASMDRDEDRLEAGFIILDQLHQILSRGAKYGDEASTASGS